MKVYQLTIQGSRAAERIREFADVFDSVAYRSDYRDGLLLASDQYSFWINGRLMVVVRFDFSEARNETVRVEIIAGGGREGLIGISFGNEGRQVKKRVREMETFCRKNGLSVQVTVLR